MSRYCLDTVTYSHFKRGEAKVTKILDRAEWIGVPVIVIGELCAGFAKGSRLQKNLDELNEFLIEELRRKGRPVRVNEVWIAATCVRAGATLLTWDTHFRPIPRVGTIVLEDLAIE